MRILQVHNRYRQPGGEDVMVDAERRLLKRYGHEVLLLETDNDRITSLWTKARAALQVAYSPASRARVHEAIRRFEPDVVHVHNFFPLWTPSVYDACDDAGIPVVQTLHNYRTICAGATLLRNGAICEHCMHGSAYRAVRHRCYRGSRVGTFAVARMIEVHRRRGTWQKRVDRYIALTEFARRKFIEAGFPEDRIAVKGNFTEDDGGDGPRHSRRRYALFVGRLSPEKGIHVLLRAWRELELPLRLVGDGPLMHVIRRDADGARRGLVKVLGRRSRREVFRIMRGASVLVVPSVCYEGCPITILEAFCCGVPVIASRLGATAEIVEHGETGLHFDAGDAGDLAAKVRWTAAHPEAMRRMAENARRVYENQYTPRRSYETLVEIYRQAIEERASRRGGEWRGRRLRFCRWKEKGTRLILGGRQRLKGRCNRSREIA